MRYQTFVTVVLVILSAVIIIESKPVTPPQSNIEEHAERRLSLEVVNLGLRPATDIVLAKRSRVWRFVDPYPLRFTNSQVFGGPGNRNDHVECRSRQDGAPLVSIIGNRQFDRARREFCNAFVGTVVPPGHELSAQVNGLINISGSPSNLVGLISNTGSWASPDGQEGTLGAGYTINTQDCLDATDAFVTGSNRDCDIRGATRGGFYWRQSLGVSFEVYSVLGSGVSGRYGVLQSGKTHSTDEHCHSC